MPLKELEALLAQLTEMIGSSSLNEAEVYNLKSLENNLRGLVTTTKDILSDEKKKDEPLSDIDAKDLSKKCASFVEGSKKILEGVKANPALEGLVIPLSSLSVPLSHYSNTINKPDGKSLSNILKDVSWIEKLLGNDPDSVKKEKSDNTISEIQEIGKLESVESSLKTYKELSDEAEQKYNTHYSRLLGSDKIMSALQYKCNLVGNTIEQIYGAGKATQEIKSYSKRFGRVENALVKSKTVEKGVITPLSTNRFETHLALVYDAPSFEGYAKRDGINEETVESLSKYFSKLNPRSYLMGISNENMKKMDESSFLLSQTANMKEWFNITVNRRKVKALTLPELKGVSDALDNFEKKVFDYVIKGEGEVPSTQDVNLIFDSILDYTNSNLDFDGPGTQRKLEVCYMVAKGINQYVSGFEEKFNSIKTAFDKKMNAEFDRQMQEIKFGDKGNDFGPTFEALYGLYNSEADIPEESFDKAYKMLLLKDPEFRDKQYKAAMAQLEAINERDDYGHINLSFTPVKQNTWKRMPKNELVKKIGQVVSICEFAEKQQEKINNHFEKAKNSDLEGALSGYNEDIYTIITSTKFGEMEAECMERIIDGINNNENLNKIFSKDSKEVAKVLTTPERKSMDSLLHNETQFNLFTGMSKKGASALMDTVAAHKNSDSYNAIGESIKGLKKAEQNIGGAQAEDYIGVFKATLHYVNSHDSKPNREWGKERFDNAAMLMANVGFKLAKDCPEMREEIEKAMKLTMIRSDKFREFVVNRLGTDKTIEPGFKKEMFVSASIAETVLEEDFGKTMIEGNPSKQKDAYKYLEVFDKVYECEKAENIRYANIDVEKAPQNDVEEIKMMADQLPRNDKSRMM